MFKKFLGYFRDKTPAYALYSKLVEAARHPSFYEDYGVDDSVDGRFDMILLHMFLVINRLDKAEAPIGYLSRDIQEAMVADMDRSLREMGVGDMMVGKQVKFMGKAWFGRQEGYLAALNGDRMAANLQEALHRNVYRGAGGVKATASAALKDYTLAAIKVLDSSEDDAILKATFGFADPTEFAPKPDAGE